MKLSIKTIRRKLLLIILFPLLTLMVLLFRTLPITKIRKFAVCVGKHFYKKAHKSRHRALTNLEMAYGKEKTLEERTAIAQAVFIEMIKSFFDYMAFSRITSRERFFSYIEVEGEEHLRAAYEQGKGVICLIPHLSSWEFSAITPPMLGYETSGVSQAMKQRLLEKMMIKYRQRRGMKNISRKGSYEKLVETLRKGECLILMIDQDTKVKGVFVDFFGKKAYTPLGASRLALETGAAVVPMVMTRKENDDYRFIISPALPLIETGDIEHDLLANTQQQTKVIEDMVRAYPEQWVWMHARWKTTPERLEAYRKKKQEQSKH
ncbi:hypothetical protein D0T50_04615 [Bacteroides sp. 214]|uniref:lysophospholipid acyltransferase family protein n=1 Tax=Bacteroides sp. 214 TaxID=2302935 RepID=UPI0013CF523E|nr:lysophospholipid acyltransferase family protein [Bacteroides sp. 214]NDW12173.1 hypothetical protein [Bacteroides sp. 214]